MKVKSESEVAQSSPTPSDPMDCSPPGSSIRGTLQARVLEWGAIAFSERVPCCPTNGGYSVARRLRLGTDTSGCRGTAITNRVALDTSLNPENPLPGSEVEVGSSVSLSTPAFPGCLCSREEEVFT